MLLRPACGTAVAPLLRRTVSNFRIRDRLNWVDLRFWARVYFFARKGVTLPQHRQSYYLAQSRFRLTRFGFQRLHAGATTMRSRPWQNRLRKARVSGIDYVHQVDENRVRKWLGGVRYIYRYQPRPHYGVSASPASQLRLPAHFG